MNEKNLKLNVVERQAIITKRARELAVQKEKDLQRKLEEAEVKLA